MKSIFRSCEKVRVLLLFFVTLFYLNQITIAQAPTHTGKFNPVIDDNINGFYEYLPRNYSVDVNRTYPLLIFMHGAGAQGASQDITTLNKVLSDGPPKIISNGTFPDSFYVGNQWFKFIVISPQIKNGIAGTTSIIQPSTINNVIEYAKNTYRVDATRIYLSGLSMGGGALWDFAGSSSVYANKVAAIVVAAGAGDLSQSEANIIAASNLPVLATHNTGDNIIGVGRTQTNVSNILAYTPTINPLPKAVYWNSPGPSGTWHNVWTRTCEEIQPAITPGGNLRDTLGINLYEWMLGNKRSAAAPVPLQWKNFIVKEINGSVQLKWVVANQVNVKEYAIEKSRNGIQWLDAATLIAKQSAGLIEYDYIDNSPYTENTWYRIRQTDWDSKFSFSGIVKIRINKNFQNSLKIYPNPFNEQTIISIPPLTGPIFIQLSDSKGTILRTIKHAPNNGNSTISFQSLQQYSKGIYYIRLVDENGQVLSSNQVVKQ